jgi:hypothetical protein
MNENFLLKRGSQIKDTCILLIEIKGQLKLKFIANMKPSDMIASFILK